MHTVSYRWFLPLSLIFIHLTNLKLCIGLNNLNVENESRWLGQSTGHESFTADEQTFDNAVNVDTDSSAFMMWSQLLETYALSQIPSNRSSKNFFFKSDEIENYGMNAISNEELQEKQQLPLNYHSSIYKWPDVYVNQRARVPLVEKSQLHKIQPMLNPQFRPNQMVQHQQHGFLPQFVSVAGSGNSGAALTQSPNRPVPLQYGLHGLPNTFRAVSENDLYLLGAIEKLVYRVDYLESRVRRTEQLIYYLMAGNSQKEVRDPCPANFTRLSDNCYYINNYKATNWKTANTACKALGAHLAEFEKPSENEVIIAYLLNQSSYRGRDYWLGGLNPGLLWIWANSAKPVNPHTNLTSIVMTHKPQRERHNNNYTELNINTTDPSINIVDNESDKIDQQRKGETNQDFTKHGSHVIKGSGRCLRLSYNASKHNYDYYGQECTSRHHYICEYTDKTLDNKIKKLTRQLNLFNDK